ncbi:hypothetical protein HID58_007166, partial [Brassica napus]
KDIFKGRSSSSKSLDEGSASGSRNIVRVKTQRKVGIVKLHKLRVGEKLRLSMGLNKLSFINEQSKQEQIFGVSRMRQTERNSRPHEQVHPLTNFCQLKKPKLNSKTLSTCKL